MAEELNQTQINSIVEHINLIMDNIKIYVGRIEESIKKLDRRGDQSIRRFQDDLKVLTDSHKEAKEKWDILKISKALKLMGGSISDIDNAFGVIKNSIRDLNSGFVNYMNNYREFIYGETFFSSITMVADTIKRHLKFRSK